MNMEKYCWEDAWLLLAVKNAQENNETVTAKEVEMAGDIINHAIFEDSEIEHGISVLTPTGLLEVNEGVFKLGPSFQSLWDKSGAKKYRGDQKQLEMLCKSMGIT
ncbi:MAG: hypothetical protein ABW094_08740 [Candidatus Thiodiazotropha sp.]